MAHRTCPNCGAAVSQKADTCFMCGYRFDAPQGPRFRIPWADVALALVIVGLVALWWRWDDQRRVLALTPSPTPTFTATPTFTPTPTATPTITPTPTPAPTATPIIYTVQPGDTYYGIAGQFGIDLEGLLAANPQASTNALQPGQTLIIPTPTPLAETPTPTPEPLSGLINYPVERGDTIQAIAIRFHVDPAVILANNDIPDPNRLQVGQVLIIPVGTFTPTPTPAITATPTPGWQAPVLISPAQNAVYAGEPGPLLRWVAQGLLPQDAWYQVHVQYVDPHLPSPAPVLTKATSYRLPQTWRPPSGAIAPELRWWVRIVRRSRQGQLIPLSPPSPIRTFQWR